MLVSTASRISFAEAPEEMSPSTMGSIRMIGWIAQPEASA